MNSPACSAAQNGCTASATCALENEIAAGRLDPQVGLALSWREAPQALEALVERRVRGKAVLTID